MRRTLVAVAVLVAATGCTGDRLSPHDLDGGLYDVQEVQGAGEDGPGAQLLFDRSDGRDTLTIYVNGSADGDYRIEDGRLWYTPGGRQEQPAFATWLQDFLASVPAVELDGDVLTLTSDRGEVVAEEQPDLEGD
jgi:hypothetical protein